MNTFTSFRRSPIATEADREKARAEHDAILRKHAGATVAYIGGTGTEDEYLEERAHDIARRRIKNEKLAFRRRRARERKKRCGS